MKIKRFFIFLLVAVFCMLPLLPAANAAPCAEPEFKNVIFMIGDGMGENHLKLAVQEGYTLFMEDNADNRGQSETRSRSEVTDSAAGATALSAGVRINNYCVGTYAIDTKGQFLHPRYISEHALRKGMGVGIVTTDKTTGATPAGFSAHVADRSMGEEITAQQLEGGFDLIWGAAVDETTREAVENKGLTYVSTREEMNALQPGEKSFGQFGPDTWRLSSDSDASPALAEMTEKAIALLNAENENGFFLMVEGAHIDKQSHRTDNGVDFPEKRACAAEAVKGFDNAIRAAVNFARADGHTLVVVTADHETGSLSLENGEYAYHSGDHSAANVPVLVYGCDDLIPQGEAVENKSLPRRVAAKLGWNPLEFPRVDPGEIFAQLKARFGLDKDRCNPPSPEGEPGLLQQICDMLLSALRPFFGEDTGIPLLSKAA